MVTGTGEVVLTVDDLRAVADFAAGYAQEVLGVFEEAQPTDPRPREAIDDAVRFAQGGKRTASLRATSSAAHAAARETDAAAASEAARAAAHAAAAAYLHPLAKATQVKHILGAAAHAARTIELLADDDRQVGARQIERACRRASPTVVDVLARYPAAPAAGGRTGELMRALDHALRARA